MLKEALGPSESGTSALALCRAAAETSWNLDLYKCVCSLACSLVSEMVEMADLRCISGPFPLYLCVWEGLAGTGEILQLQVKNSRK